MECFTSSFIAVVLVHYTTSGAFLVVFCSKYSLSPLQYGTSNEILGVKNTRQHNDDNTIYNSATEFSSTCRFTDRYTRPVE